MWYTLQSQSLKVESSLNTLPFLPFHLPSSVNFFKVGFLCLIFDFLSCCTILIALICFLTIILVDSSLVLLLSTLMSHNSSSEFVPHLLLTFSRFLHPYKATALTSSHVCPCPQLPTEMCLKSAPLCSPRFS